MNDEHIISITRTRISENSFFQCQTQDLSNVYIWGKNYLDISNAKRTSKFGPGKHSFCTLKTQNVIELLPMDWIKSFLIPQFVRIIILFF